MAAGMLGTEVGAGVPHLAAAALALRERLSDAEVPDVLDGEVLNILDGEVLGVLDGEVPDVLDGEVPNVLAGEVPNVLAGEVPNVLDGAKAEGLGLRGGCGEHRRAGGLWG